MLWKIFGSERRVQEALDQSIGYDISPNILIGTPANNDRPASAQPVLDLWREYAVTLADTSPVDNRRSRKKA